MSVRNWEASSAAFFRPSPAQLRFMESCATAADGCNPSKARDCRRSHADSQGVCCHGAGAGYWRTAEALEAAGMVRKLLGNMQVIVGFGLTRNGSIALAAVRKRAERAAIRGAR